MAKNGAVAAADETTGLKFHLLPAESQIIPPEVPTPLGIINLDPNLWGDETLRAQLGDVLTPLLMRAEHFLLVNVFQGSFSFCFLAWLYHFDFSIVPSIPGEFK